MKMETK